MIPKQTGLFSAVVSAFIIETYKTLLPPSGSASGTQATFTPPGIAIRVNILMVLSLFLSLTCALMSTLIQQWARVYLQCLGIGVQPHKRGRVRAYFFDGLNKFQMRRMAEFIPVLLHISVFLFFFAFSEFLRNVHNTVGLVARYCTIVLLSAYLILSILPIIF
ncbi:hypothetical protein BC826DRAFT_907670, partial [Russula brevipes]